MSVFTNRLIFVQQKKAMDTRERIVDTASRLFYKQGYNNTGINQVIKEAEVAKASLYQHFPSKEDLLIEYLNVTAKATNKTLREIAGKFEEPKDKILALFDFLLDYSNINEFNGCNFLNVAAELPQEKGRVKETIRKQKNEIRALFEELLKPINKEYLADELYILFDAALISGKVYGDLWPVKTTRKIVEKLI